MTFNAATVKIVTNGDTEIIFTEISGIIFSGSYLLFSIFQF